MVIVFEVDAKFLLCNEEDILMLQRPSAEPSL